MMRIPGSMACLLACAAAIVAQEPSGASHPLRFIDTTFEHASPLWWEVDGDGVVQIYLAYDQERSSPNRANGHWLFRVDAEPGAQLTLELGPFANIWNRQPSSANPEAKVAFVSDDGHQWRPIDTEPAAPHRLRIPIRMSGDSLFVARLEPYRISDLERLKSELSGHPLVEITPIGHTVERRELEILRVGRLDAPHRILLRARAHPWEPGGNWVIEGLVRRLLCDDEEARRYRDCYCVYIMPMANKDGVARGRTRFNLRGMDLNRNWDRPAAPDLAPENAALENWIERQVADKPIDLMIDFHNDAFGQLHISRPDLEPAALEAYVNRMKCLEQALRDHTWFTEGSTGSSFRNPGSIGEGLLARYGIMACVLELNANWIAGVDDYPTAHHWTAFGQQMATALLQFFESD